ncbi:hypothetical protein ABT160_46045 [Streptomyces sp. NPDC001941]
MPVGHVPRASGPDVTQYACPDHVHDYPPRAVWDELPVMRR